MTARTVLQLVPDTRTHPGTEQDTPHAATVMDGLTNREIAARRSLSTNTVKTYVRLVYRKVGVSSRAQAAACGYRNRLQGASHVL